VTVLTERRRHAAWGLAGGGNGACGENLHDRERLPAKASIEVASGDCLSVSTPGGGGWGALS
jgi:N-methylhydantoinase B